MSSIQVRKLTDATPAELDKAAKVLAAAFKEDIFANACLGGNQDLNIPFQRATIAAAAIGGELYVAGYGDNDILGVAAWFGPGQELLSSPEQGAAGFNALMGSFPPELSKWWMEYFLPKYAEQTTKVLGEGTKHAAWHLQLFGVLPEHQGKGIGSKLMKVVEEQAISRGELTCLETDSERNVEIYKHWGYLLKGEERYESSTGGFPMYVLIKDPKTAA